MLTFLGLPAEVDCEICNKGTGFLDLYTSLEDRTGIAFMWPFYTCNHCGCEYGSSETLRVSIYANNFEIYK